jgi:putative ABC transport system substrate-binding protein
MRRREFIAFIGGAAAWPLAGQAQQGDRVRRVSVLSSQAMDSLTETVWLDTLRQELARLGWAEGGNLHIDVRYSEGRLERAQAIVKELVALRPDVILGESTTCSS